MKTAKLAKPVKTTGRRFKCIGLEEHHCIHWKDHFKVGDIYHEAEHDADMEDKSNKHSLLLVYRKFYPLYVDRTQFKLTVKVIHGAN